MSSTPDTTCPKCGSQNIIPIVYGMPDADLIAQEAAGELVVGGCAEYDDSPTQACSDCGHHWGRLGRVSGSHVDGADLGDGEVKELADEVKGLDDEAREHLAFMNDKDKS